MVGMAVLMTVTSAAAMKVEISMAAITSSLRTLRVGVIGVSAIELIDPLPTCSLDRSLP